ncbi:MAG: DUF3857 and transglutaminase domain-containing protein [Saprospiraceae bacterium]|nr:DUF3857 and transglutaminase domain-containing protein [Saprospiraceae bacterium]
MKKLYSCFIFTLLFAPTIFWGQNVITKWGKVSDDEWKLTQCNFDTSASAIILFDVAYIHFNGGSAQIDRHRRIKILRTDGIEYANLVLPYVYQNGRENITDIKAQTINPGENGKPQEIPVENKQEFQSKVDEYWAQVNLAFPAVRPGSIIEYRYSFHTQNIYFLKPWFFQNELPTVYSEVSVEVPSYLSYNILKFGKMLKQLPSQTDQNKWSLNRIPGYKSEKFVFHPEDYAEQIQFQLLSYNRTNTSNLSGGYETVNVLESWDKLGEDVLTECNAYLNRDKGLQNILENIVQPSDNTKDKARKIIQYVHEQFAWNNYWSIRPSQSFNSFESSRKGSTAEINLLLIGLLREAGLEADPVMVSTRFHGKVVKSFPLLSQFNNLICRVVLDGETYFLDAALDQGMQPALLLAKENLNFHGFLLRKGQFDWIEIETKNITRRNTIVTIDLAKMTGELRFKNEGYAAGDLRRAWHQANNNAEAFATKAPEIGEEQLKLDEPIPKALEEREEPFEVSYQFPLELADEGFVYFSPLTWSNFAEIPFKAKERSFPIEFDYPYSDNMLITIHLPEGYYVESKPDNKSIALRYADDEGRFIFNISEVNGKLIISSKVDIKQPILAAEGYPFVKAFFEQIHAKLSEVILIKKR